MENRERDCEKTSERRTRKTITKTAYNNRKKCIKKKTMELATLCGVPACTIIYGPDGAVDSWPEDPSQVKDVIKKLKDLMSDPNNKKTVKDESIPRVVSAPTGKEIECCLKNSTAEKAKTINFLTDFPRTMVPDIPQKKVVAVPDGETSNSSLAKSRASLQSGPPSTKDYQEDFLMQLDSRMNSRLTNARDPERVMKMNEMTSVQLGPSSSKEYQKDFLKQSKTIPRFTDPTDSERLRKMMEMTSRQLGSPSSKDCHKDLVKQLHSKTISGLANPRDSEEAMKMIEMTSPHLGPSSSKECQKDFLMQLDSRTNSRCTNPRDSERAMKSSVHLSQSWTNEYMKEFFKRLDSRTHCNLTNPRDFERVLKMKEKTSQHLSPSSSKEYQEEFSKQLDSKNNSSLTNPRDPERTTKMIEKSSVHLSQSSTIEYQKEFLKQLDSKTNSSLTTPRDTERLMKFIEKSSEHLGKSSSKKNHKALLNQLDSTLESLTKRIELLTTNRQSNTDIISLKRKQANCSEDIGEKRMRINKAPPFLFDLNLPPPDESAPSTPEDDNQVDICEQ